MKISRGQVSKSPHYPFNRKLHQIYRQGLGISTLIDLSSLSDLSKVNNEQVPWSKHLSHHSISKENELRCGPDRKMGSWYSALRNNKGPIALVFTNMFLNLALSKHSNNMFHVFKGDFQNGPNSWIACDIVKRKYFQQYAATPTKSRNGKNKI